MTKLNQIQLIHARGYGAYQTAPGLGVKTIPAGLQDLEVIRSGVEAQDTTINTASADDLDVAHASIKALRRSPKSSSGGQKIYIQMSGIDEFAIVPGYTIIDSPRRIIYDDADPTSRGPTRAWEFAGQVKIAIFIVATVYGVGTGVPTLLFCWRMFHADPARVLRRTGVGSGGGVGTRVK
ncbi:hypothetical protein FB451DRAFT_1497110 [Mycena latifolia]|nr:hypothetical protein FB451DRAFT_1497110 [Mycena latifolia]